MQLAVKRTNETVGPEALCSTLLFFGSMPRPARQLPAETQLERARVINCTRNVAIKEFASRKNFLGLRHPNIPKAKEQEENSRRLLADALVIVYRTKSKEWEGPFPFVTIDERTVVMYLPHGRQIFRSTAVKPYNPPAVEEAFQSPAPPLRQQGTQAADKANILCSNISTAEARIKFKNSREIELQGLINMNAFEIIPCSFVPIDQKMYCTQWVDTIKYKEDGTIIRNS